MRSLSSCILVCWQSFGVIKWFSKLSDTHQEGRQSHKQEGAECASCLPGLLNRADSYKSLTHACRRCVAGRFFFLLEPGSSRLSGKTKTVRAGKFKTLCSLCSTDRVDSRERPGSLNHRFPEPLHARWTCGSGQQVTPPEHTQSLTQSLPESAGHISHQACVITIKAADTKMMKSQKLARIKQSRESLLVKR